MFPLVDLHVHSIASGHAFNTIDEIVNYAILHEYKIIGISDHGPDMEGAPHAGYFEMLYRLPHNCDKTIIMYGCEANILDVDGKIDLSNHLIATLDYVIAGLHKRTSYTGRSIEENTLAIEALIESQKADIVSHPISMSFMIDSEKIINCAAKNNVILECNVSVVREAILQNRLDVLDAMVDLYDKAIKNNVNIILGSDAHHVSEMELNIEDINLIENTLKLQYSKMLNYYPDKLYDILKQRKSIRRRMFYD